jgi:hypothetical protein
MKAKAEKKDGPVKFQRVTFMVDNEPMRNPAKALALRTDESETDQETELTAFYQLYDTDFLSASQIIELLDQTKDARYVPHLIEALIVAYARPFSGNRGRWYYGGELQRPKNFIEKHLPWFFSKVRPHKLEAGKVVPTKLRPLHKELIQYRNQVVAHTAQEWLRPRFGIAGMSFRRFPFEQIVAKLPQIKSLVDEVRKALGKIAKPLNDKLNNERLRMMQELRSKAKVS